MINNSNQIVSFSLIFDHIGLIRGVFRKTLNCIQLFGYNKVVEKKFKKMELKAVQVCSHLEPNTKVLENDFL